jgi:aspartate/methionine/tyrosine aminotransferase
MLAAFEARRDLIVTGLREIPGVTCVRPEGAFYAFPNVSALLGRRSGDRRIETSEDLAVHLLEQEAVAVVPGEPFGAPGYIRISFAASEERVLEGLRRLRRALQSLEPATA